MEHKMPQVDKVNLKSKEVLEGGKKEVNGS